MAPVTSSARVAVTLGDPRGIGPEVSFAAVRTGSFARSAITFYGPKSFAVQAPEGCGFIPVCDRDLDCSQDRGAGAVAVEAIVRAVSDILAGRQDAVVTAPVHKPSLRAAGLRHPGHTEFLCELSGAGEVGMLMAAEEIPGRSPLRVLLATTHHPLADVPGLVTSELLVSQSLLLSRELGERWKIDRPRIALCSLNPHASDGGIFGNEEEDVYAPAQDRLRHLGAEVSGPISADTVFVRALAGEFDAVVAPYHDVGMAAFKTAAFGKGVNVTLGIPFVRTSPDHGTAFDIAGTGQADPGSMREALELAARLARPRSGASPSVARPHGSAPSPAFSA